jgi:hypothetical protein
MIEGMSDLKLYTIDENGEEKEIELPGEISIGVDYGSKEDKSVMTIAKRRFDGKTEILGSKEIEVAFDKAHIDWNWLMKLAYGGYNNRRVIKRRTLMLVRAYKMLRR